MSNQAIEIIENVDGKVTARFFGGKVITGSSLDDFMPYLNKNYVKIQGMKIVGVEIPQIVLDTLNKEFAK